MAMLEGVYKDADQQPELIPIPGFRFYPTEEELVGFYLTKRVQGDHPLNFDIIIPTLELYRYDPWELPGLVHSVGERQWFFFVPRDHKKSCPRPNRLTVSGYWKATGSDRTIRNHLLQCIGLKKTLVFYKGKGSDGKKTDWIMNEYRMPDLSSSAHKTKDIVLCRIYRKAATRKSMDEEEKFDAIQKDEPVVSVHEYENKSISVTFNRSSNESNPNPGAIQKEEPVFSGYDYEESRSDHLITGNRTSCELNPMTNTVNDLSLPCNEKDKQVCYSLCQTNSDASLFECLEPMMFNAETMVLKTPKDCKRPLQLELPNLSIDCLFNQRIATPYAILSTPSPFQIPFV